MDESLKAIDLKDVNAGVTFVNGKLVAAVNYVNPVGVSASVNLSVDSDQVLDAIALAIPGKIDDAVIALIKAALKGISA